MASEYFDWQRFCDLHQIPYVTQGPNTARGNLSIKCPWCGPADPSEHMGLSLNRADPKWGCLRNPEHRGRSVVRLIRELLHCSEARAQSLLKAMAPELDAFEQVAASLFSNKNIASTSYQKPTPVLKWLPTAKPITQTGYGAKFLSYLSGRGFTSPQDLVERYDLRYCLVGAFAWRLLIPFHLHSNLVGWTGRSIHPDAFLRYFTLPADPQKAEAYGVPAALYDPLEYVWNQDAVQEQGEVLVICEGPVDALKLDYYRPSEDFTVAGLLGMPKGNQLMLLGNAARRYQKVVVVLDQGAFSVASTLAQQIEELSGTRSLALNPPAKDPGAMTEKQVRNFLLSLTLQ